MQLWADGTLSPAQLESYRAAAADDARPPQEVLEDRGLPLPADAAPSAEGSIRALVAEADLYLARLHGPGLAESRAGIARFCGGAVKLAAAAHPVCEAHLAQALAATDTPALSAAIAAAAPHLFWQSFQGYAGQDIGAGFAQGHAYASLIGCDRSSIPGEDYDLGLFLIAPHVLYRDHTHAAPELYAPLTGSHGWRFGANRPLVLKPAHQPVWNPANRAHLTKVGPVPFLALYAWTRDVTAKAYIIPASDWPELESMHLG